jgi:rod shape-determining protein MreC
MDNTFSERNELIKENKALQEERLVNLQALQRFDSLVQENIRLREILNASAKLNDNVQIARIISADINPFRHIIVVDKGTQDNLYNGQPWLILTESLAKYFRQAFFHLRQS